MITLQNIHFARGEHAILSDISTQFPPGQIHAILGANGAGKSTLLRLIAGELHPQQGNILINEQNIRQLTYAKLAQIRAFLPQSPSLNFALRVNEIVAMGAYPFPAMTQAEVDALIAKCLAMADIQSFGKRAYLNLSGGEQQRVQFARTLVQTLAPSDSASRYLFLDEPTASLDPKHQHALLRCVRGLAAELGVGVIVVLHDVNLAAQYADRLLLLADSQLIAHGARHEVLTQDNLAAVYQMRPTIVSHPADAKRPLVLFD
jgi:iron complex transport system ATP-binding protein